MKTITLMIVAASMGLIASAQAEEGKKDRPQRKLPPEVIEKFDKDGDGQPNEAEREAAKAEHKARREGHWKEALEKFDTDKDGKLSEDEKKAMRDAMKARMLEKFDKDGDGELSKEERAEMRKSMHDRPHGKKERCKKAE